MMTNIKWGPVLSVLQLVFAVVGLATGWISETAALSLLGTGVATFGVHDSVVKAGRTRY